MSTNTNVQLIPGDLVLSGDIKTDEVTPTFSVDRQNSRVGIGIDASSISNPYTMYVAGEMYATQLHGDGSQLTGLTDSVWDIAGNDISYADGDVSIGIADANGKRLRVHESGNDVLVADGANLRVGVATGTPQANLHVEGNAYVSSNLDVSNVNFTGNLYQNGTLFEGGGGGVWTETGNDIYYTTGKVGVGTNSPSGTLHIATGTSSGHDITASPTSQWGTLLEPEVYDSGFSMYYNSGNISGVANDSSGNVYVVGSYRSDNAYDLGNGVSLPAATLPAVSTAGYLIKYISSGTPQWANTFIPANSQYTSAESVATDSNGNVYVTGRFKSSVDFGNSITLTGSGQTNAFIVKFNGSGVDQWAKEMSGSSVCYPYGIATDSSGNVYTVGYYNSTTSIDLGNSVILSASNISDAFLVKHNTDGVAQWVINIDTSGTCILWGVTTDSGGNVFVTGQYASNSDVSLAPYVTLPNSSNVTHGFIVKYTSGTTQGTALWVKVINGTATGVGRNVATDSNGNIYLVGQYRSTSSIDLGNSVSLPVTVFSDAFVVKYNTGGTPQWAKSISGTGNDSTYGIATNSNGDVYVVGDYTSTSDIDIGNNLTLSANSSANTQEGFIIIYDTDGTPQSVRIVSGSSARVQLRQIKVDSNNNIYVGGAGLPGTNQITIDDNTTLTRSTNASSMMQDYTGLLIKYVTQGLLPDTALTVVGNAYVSSNLEVSNVNFTGNLYQNGTLFESSPWTTTGDDIYYTTGNIGVGTTNPGANLHVEGNAYVSSNLEVGTANLFVDTVNSRVGVGTTTPSRTLDVHGAARPSGYPFAIGGTLSNRANYVAFTVNPGNNKSSFFKDITFGGSQRPNWLRVHAGGAAASTTAATIQYALYAEFIFVTNGTNFAAQRKVGSSNITISSTGGTNQIRVNINGGANGSYPRAWIEVYSEASV